MTALLVAWIAAGLMVAWIVGGAARLGGHDDSQRGRDE